MSEKVFEVKDVSVVLSEIEKLVNYNREHSAFKDKTIKDLRIVFDQESARMNQAIFNEHYEQLREACQRTIAVLVEILARTQ